MRVLKNKRYFVFGILGGFILGLNIIKRLEERTKKFNEDIAQLRKIYLKVNNYLIYLNFIYIGSNNM